MVVLFLMLRKVTLIFSEYGNIGSHTEIQIFELEVRSRGMVYHAKKMILHFLISYLVWLKRTIDDNRLTTITFVDEILSSSFLLDH